MKKYKLFKFDSQTGGYTLCGNSNKSYCKEEIISEVIPNEFSNYIQEEDSWIDGRPQTFEKALESFKDDFLIVEEKSEKFFSDKKAIKEMKDVFGEIFLEIDNELK